MRVLPVSHANVEMVEDFLGLGDDEHPEALILPSIVARLEEETVPALFLLVAVMGHAATWSSSFLIIDEFESLGAASHPNAVGQVGVVRRCRGLRDEVRSDQEPLVFPIGRHHHLYHALQLAILMLLHSEHVVTLVGPVCIVEDIALVLYVLTITHTPSCLISCVSEPLERDSRNLALRNMPMSRVAYILCLYLLHLNVHSMLSLSLRLTYRVNGDIFDAQTQLTESTE